MEVLFKIFSVEEKWMREAGVDSDHFDKLVTVLEDWGHEFQSEESAIAHLKDNDVQRNGDEIIIQKIIRW